MVLYAYATKFRVLSFKYRAQAVPVHHSFASMAAVTSFFSM